MGIAKKSERKNEDRKTKFKFWSFGKKAKPVPTPEEKQRRRRRRERLRREKRRAEEAEAAKQGKGWFKYLPFTGGGNEKPNRRRKKRSPKKWSDSDQRFAKDSSQESPYTRSRSLESKEEESKVGSYITPFNNFLKEKTLNLGGYLWGNRGDVDQGRATRYKNPKSPIYSKKNIYQESAPTSKIHRSLKGLIAIYDGKFFRYILPKRNEENCKSTCSHDSHEGSVHSFAGDSYTATTGCTTSTSTSCAASTLLATEDWLSRAKPLTGESMITKGRNNSTTNIRNNHNSSKAKMWRNSFTSMQVTVPTFAKRDIGKSCLGRLPRIRKSGFQIVRPKSFIALCDSVFDSIDIDDSGCLEEGEVYQGILLMHLKLGINFGQIACQPITREECRSLFQKIDEGDSGVLDKVEFRDMMTMVFENMLCWITIQWVMVIIAIPLVVQRFNGSVEYLVWMLFYALINLYERTLMPSIVGLVAEDVMEDIPEYVKDAVFMMENWAKQAYSTIPEHFINLLPITLTIIFLSQVLLPRTFILVDRASRKV